MDNKIESKLDNKTDKKLDSKTNNKQENKSENMLDSESEEVFLKLQVVSDAIRSYKTESWSQFPNIDLYMDQVMTYLERLLNIMGETDGARSITASMVNNYVKEGYLKRPLKKKYDRVHIASLYILSMLKPILPISLIADSLSGLKDEKDYELFFKEFGKLQDKAFDNVADQLDVALSHNNSKNFEDTLRLFALQLTSEANARKITAEKILTALNKKDLINKEKKK